MSGFSRIEAIKQLRGDRVKAIVMADISNDEAFRLSYIENAKRQSLTPMDKAYVVGRLEEAEEFFKLRLLILHEQRRQLTG